MRNVPGSNLLDKTGKTGVRVEWRFLESNRWLYKERCSRQERPTWSVIEGALSSSIDEGASHAACYRTYCCGTSTEPASRVPPGGVLPVQRRTDGARHRRPHQPDMCCDLRPSLHPDGDALYLLKSNTQRRPLMPCGGRASQCDTRRPRPGAGVPAHRWVLQGASAACRVAAVWPDAPERTAASAASTHRLALARPCGEDRGWLGGLHAGHGGQSTGVSPAR